MNKDTGTDGAVHTSGLAAAIRAVEDKPRPNCRKCVWAKSLGEQPKHIATWVYCPFGGVKCLFGWGRER